MGIINEEIKFEKTFITEALLEVVEHTHDEMYEPWHFIYLTIDMMNCLSPKELKEIGHWLIKQGNYLGRKYTSKGALKTKKESQ